MVLLEKIHAHEAKVAIIGLGYVGLPLAVLQAQTGFDVIGIEEISEKVELILTGKSYVGDVGSDELREVVQRGRLRASTSFDALAGCDIVIICVPTPLTAHKEPDITAIVKVTREVAKRLRPGMLVILESTTYPGTTDEVIQPMLVESGHRAGVDFFLAFSPERVDPGNPSYKTHNTLKLVGGVTPACTRIAQTFYEQSIQRILPLSSSRVAEMTKVFENVFRSVNIALVNELALLCDRMGLNPYEVIQAAATKNFGFMPFYPGPGVGGHCIPLDPYYLAWKAREYDMPTRFIELAGEINESMPRYVVGKLQRLLNGRGRCLNGAKIFVLGVTYKADVADPRETPARKVFELLQAEGARLSYADPYAAVFEAAGRRYESVAVTPKVLQHSDAVLILTGHSAFDYDLVVTESALVFDTRNATQRARAVRPSDRVVLL